MRKVTQQEFDSAYELHQIWLEGYGKGKRMVFDDCDLRRIKFPEKADLRWADFSEANCIGANFSEANLYGAYLIEANCSEANFSEANLCRADLCRADLRKANCIGANFSEADLRWANLIEANCSEANLRGADLTKTLHKNTFQKTNGRTCIWVPSKNGIIVYAGCFRGTIDEFEAAARKKHGNKEPDNYTTEIKMLREIEKSK